MKHSISQIVNLLAFTATWDSSLLVTGRLNRQDFKEALEQVLTSFAADYYRANQ